MPGSPGLAFHHLRLIGATEDLVLAAREAGIAQEVTTPPEATTPVDLVAVLKGAVGPKAAAAHVAPGGTLYYESPRKIRFSNAYTLGRELMRLGFAVDALYWIKPNTSEPAMFLPAQPRAALVWYLDALFTPITPVRRVAQRVWRLIATRAAPVFWLTVRSFAIVATRTGSTAPARAARLMLTDNGERAVILGLGINAAEPMNVVKIAKLPGFGPKTRREHSVVRRIHAEIDSRLSSSLPQAICCDEKSGLIVTTETFVGGQSLLSLVGSWPLRVKRQAEYLDLAVDWLIEFHVATRRNSRAQSLMALTIRRRLETYSDLFGRTAGEERLFSRLESVLQMDSLISLPTVWQHNDFGLWNLWLNHGRVHVIDWEGGRIGPALVDLLYLLTSWHDTARGAGSLDDKLHGFTELFLERGGRGRVSAAKASLGNYLSALGIPSRLVPLLLTLTWVNLALGRHARLARLSASRRHVRHDNQPVRYVELLAGRRDDLEVLWND